MQTIYQTAERLEEAFVALVHSKVTSSRWISAEEIAQEIDSDSWSVARALITLADRMTARGDNGHTVYRLRKPVDAR